MRKSLQPIVELYLSFLILSLLVSSVSHIIKIKFIDFLSLSSENTYALTCRKIN
jgi:hypothetical protein